MLISQKLHPAKLMAVLFCFWKPSWSQHNFPLWRREWKSSFQCVELRELTMSPSKAKWVLVMSCDINLPIFLHHPYTNSLNKHCGNHQPILKRDLWPCSLLMLGSITVRTWKTWIISHPQLFPTSKSYRSLVLSLQILVLSLFQRLEVGIIGSLFLSFVWQFRFLPLCQWKQRLWKIKGWGLGE